MSINRYFYNEIPSLNRFAELTNPQNFQKVPSDWYVLTTHVLNAPDAIRENRYKSVNIVSVLSIIAVVNISKDTKIPFIFHGEGATMLIPPEFLDAAKDVLVDTMKIAKRDFNLNLEVAAIPLQDIEEQDGEILLAKHKVSKHYKQAIALGSGLRVAKRLFHETPRYHFDRKPSLSNVSFKGFECRWQNIKSPKEEVVTLLVEAREGIDIYSELLAKIDQIYGDANYRKPVNMKRLKLSFGKELLSEGMVFSKNNMLKVMTRYIRLFGEHLQAKFRRSDELLAYKSKLIDSVDFQKFDDRIGMVISGTKNDRLKLTTYLDELYISGKIYYGISSSKKSIMTSLVFDREGEQVHFIDGLAGGYTLAERELKKQKAQR